MGASVHVHGCIARVHVHGCMCMGACAWVRVHVHACPTFTHTSAAPLTAAAGVGGEGGESTADVEDEPDLDETAPSSCQAGVCMHIPHMVTV